MLSILPCLSALSQNVSQSNATAGISPGHHRLCRLRDTVSIFPGCRGGPRGSGLTKLFCADQPLAPRKRWVSEPWLKCHLVSLWFKSLREFYSDVLEQTAGWDGTKARVPQGFIDNVRLGGGRGMPRSYLWCAQGCGRPATVMPSPSAMPGEE